ncbi:MAG: HIT domain-containing protein [Deltaproteobacteria bacterium]|nr:HIT domain-containing protein [Deltaproteobacteria bacterium]
MSNCIFCRIIAGEIPCSKVYEDDLFLAFDDINPVAPVHVVVVPKKHIPTLMDVADDGLMQGLTDALRATARIKGIDNRGFKMVINCNKEGGQVIYHLHAHLIGGGTIDKNKI